MVRWPAAAFLRTVIRCNFRIDLPQQHQSHHLVIGEERPERILESSGLVLLNKEVRYPGCPIAGYESERNEEPALHNQTSRQGCQCRDAANQVKGTRGWPAVFGKVVGPELPKRFEAVVCHIAISVLVIGALYLVPCTSLTMRPCAVQQSTLAKGAKHKAPSTKRKVQSSTDN